MSLRWWLALDVVLLAAALAVLAILGWGAPSLLWFAVIWVVISVAWFALDRRGRR